MNRIAIVLAAAAALFLAAAPLTSAVAANKKLFSEGLMEELKKAREGVAARMAAKK